MPDPDTPQGRLPVPEAGSTDDPSTPGKARQDARLDEALDETFPASDPISSSKID